MEREWDNWGPGWDQQQPRQQQASQEDEARAAEDGEEAGSSGTATKRRFSLGLLGKKIASAANNLGEAVARWVLRAGCSPLRCCLKQASMHCCGLCALHFLHLAFASMSFTMLQDGSCCGRGDCRCGAALPLRTAAQRGGQEGGRGCGQGCAPAFACLWLGHGRPGMSNLMACLAAMRRAPACVLGRTLRPWGSPAAALRHCWFSLPRHLQACSRAPGALLRGHAQCKAFFTSCSRCLLA